MTVKTRITLYIVAAGFLASLLFSVVVFYEMIEQPFQLLDAVLQEEAYRAVRLVEREQRESDPAYADLLSQESERYWIKILDKDTSSLLFRSELAKRITLTTVEPGSSAIASKIIPREVVDLDQDSHQEVTFRVRTFLVPLNGRTFVAQIARPIEKLEEEIWDVVLGIVSGLVFSILGLTAISRFFADKILQPIGRMKDLAQVISEKNLDQRMNSASWQRPLTACWIAGKALL
jgi:two-component system OmpR family sensor kinase